MLVAEADGAVHLHGRAIERDGRLRRLGARGGRRRMCAGFVAVEKTGRLLHQRARQREADMDVHGLELQRLKGAERTAKLVTRLQVIERESESRLRDAYQVGGDQNGERRAQPIACGARGLAGQRAVRPAIVEREVCDVEPIDRAARADRQARRVARHER